MKRATQIIQILEGFKLGSLGVSRKPKVMPLSTAEPQKQQDAEDYPTPKKGVHSVIKVSWIKSKYSHWIAVAKLTETSGYNFIASCDNDLFSKDKDKYTICFEGGPNIEISFNSKLKMGTVKNSHFMVKYMFTAVDDKAAEQVLREKIAVLEHEMSFGYALASGKLGSGWLAIGRTGFTTYIYATSGVEKSPHFRIA
jgi:hypothetical protein